MTDELTPEEKEELKNLPKERMPIGLEARVVDAMRDKGFLAKRRRTIEITNSRVAGLLAACLVLMIGAYSIGLYRGDGERFLPGAVTTQRADGGRTEVPAKDAEERRDEQPVSVATTQTEQSVANGSGKEQTAPPKTKTEETPSRKKSDGGMIAADDVDRMSAAKKPAAEAGSDIPEVKVGSEVQSRPNPVAKSNEETATNRARQLDSKDEILVSGAKKSAAAPPQEEAMPQAVLKQSSPQLRALSEGESLDTMSKEQLTFLLNGSQFVVEAPDSVRIKRDDRGRVLLIYTSEGIIRIRLADDK